jgi:hypothetical protein
LDCLLHAARLGAHECVPGQGGKHAVKEVGGRHGSNLLPGAVVGSMIGSPLPTENNLYNRCPLPSSPAAQKPSLSFATICRSKLDDH